MEKIGFFGGCFNPPTLAHINLANEVVKEFGLSKLIFVPVGNNYEKKDLISAEHRINMLDLACEKYDYLDVSDIELSYNKKLYAVDIINILADLYNKNETYFIMGSDNLTKMPKWKDSINLIEKHKFIVLDRIPYKTEDVINSNNLLKKNSKNFKVFNCNMSTSSTSARENIESTEITKIIPEDIVQYIQENRLYRGNI